MPSDSDFTRRLQDPEHPRSASYDPHWVLENMMGPNSLWLAESLASVMRLERGMRVLDMGCGRAISSIFLAKEFGVQVWATDLWISASDNWTRINEAGVADLVYPIHAEAHELPFASGFFDAAVSLDAYHYFGTDDLYLGNFAPLVRSGGELGICVPGVQEELGTAIPSHLRPFWKWEFASFHSPAWWKKHWEKSGLVDVTHADTVPGGWKQWLLWGEIVAAYGKPGAGKADAEDEREPEMLRVDAGRNLGLSRVVARLP